MTNQITHLVPFAAALSTAVCNQPNNRFNNMAMLRALNAQAMMEIVNLKKAAEAIIAKSEVEDIVNLKLTYDRFMTALSITKHYLLTVNS